MLPVFPLDSPVSTSDVFASVIEGRAGGISAFVVHGSRDSLETLP
jgi:hypothetical protein